MNKSINDPVRYLKGIGPSRAKLLKRVGIETIEDLLYYFPRRYEDRTNFSVISQLEEGQVRTIKAKILIAAERRSFRRRGFSIVELMVADQTGKINCVWFNRPYLKQYFKIGESLILYGKAEQYSGRLQLSNPEFELVSEGEDEPADIGRIIPVYSLPEGMTQRYFRRIVKLCLDNYLPQVLDFLPYDIRARNHLLNLAKGIVNIHFPDDFAAQKEAFQRLAFEGFLLFQIPLALRKLRWKEKKGIAHSSENGIVEDFIRQLPFKLTAGQEKAAAEIRGDMAKPLVMQRLLQGDVGSGKTVVATIAALAALQGNYQAVLLVPTEVLAKQHFEKISAQLAALSRGRNKIKAALLTSSAARKEKENICAEISDGKVDLVIGTHALLEEKVVFKNLGLVVIDEQHKFGVAQRALLPQKEPHPDVLIMTATPIPRTLAITLYGDLDISVINELPAGRKPIITQCLGIGRREKLYGLIRGQVQAGRQVYVIYPIIEESFDLDLLSAEKMYAEFRDKVFKEFQVGMIHGRLKQEEQDRAMSDFKSGQIQILIATTVLEVGIDVANASMMVIEHAERFGLSQLHQLRGRIGRGPYESFCILVSDARTPEAEARLKAMVKYNSGFHIADEDLKIRGPGEFFGRRQHGLSEMGIANPLAEMELLKTARQEAIRLVDTDPGLAQKQNLLLKKKLVQRFPEYERLIMVG